MRGGGFYIHSPEKPETQEHGKFFFNFQKYFSPSSLRIWVWQLSPLVWIHTTMVFFFICCAPKDLLTSNTFKEHGGEKHMFWYLDFDSHEPWIGPFCKCTLADVCLKRTEGSTEKVPLYNSHTLVHLAQTTVKCRSSGGWLWSPIMNEVLLLNRHVISFGDFRGCWWRARHAWDVVDFWTLSKDHHTYSLKFWGIKCVF